MDKTDLMRALTALGSIPIERVEEIMQAEHEGRLVVLPCEVGDTVYENRWGEVEVAYGYMQPKFDTFSKRFSLYDFYKLGKTVFLTREAAEAALKGASND